MRGHKAPQRPRPPAPEIEEPEAEAPPKLRSGRPVNRLAKKNNPEFRPFNHHLNAFKMADLRYLLGRMKIEGTLPEGVNDMADLVQLALDQWYERNTGGEPRETW